MMHIVAITNEDFIIFNDYEITNIENADYCFNECLGKNVESISRMVDNVGRN